MTVTIEDAVVLTISGIMAMHCKEIGKEWCVFAVEAAVTLKMLEALACSMGISIFIIVVDSVNCGILTIVGNVFVLLGQNFMRIKGSSGSLVGL